MGARRGELLGALEGELGVLVRRAWRVIGERAAAVHPELPAGSYLLLAHLAADGPLRASALVERFGIDKGAISRQVQQLEELGLVQRTPDPADGRAQLVGATPDAVRRLGAVASQRREMLGERLAGWSERDLAALVDALGRYNEALG